MTKKTQSIWMDLLGRLSDRLEARIPSRTSASVISADQRDVNARIDSDRALVDEARKILRPSFQNTVDSFAGWSLEELRMAREVALHNGNNERALALATAVDIKRGFYK